MRHNSSSSSSSVSSSASRDAKGVRSRDAEGVRARDAKDVRPHDAEGVRVTMGVRRLQIRVILVPTLNWLCRWPFRKDGKTRKSRRRFPQKFCGNQHPDRKDRPNTNPTRG